MTEKIFIYEDNEQREATHEEALQIKEDIAEIEAREEARKSEKDARDLARTSALAKLAALGLTEEEIAAL
jgi:hypothetical protein